jgi:hypothetical protein
MQVQPWEQVLLLGPLGLGLQGLQSKNKHIEIVQFYKLYIMRYQTIKSKYDGL